MVGHLLTQIRYLCDWKSLYPEKNYNKWNNRKLRAKNKRAKEPHTKKIPIMKEKKTLDTSQIRIIIIIRHASVGFSLVFVFDTAKMINLKYFPVYISV